MEAPPPYSIEEADESQSNSPVIESNRPQIICLFYGDRRAISALPDSHADLESTIRRLFRISPDKVLILSVELPEMKNERLEMDPELWSSIKAQVSKIWVNTEISKDHYHSTFDATLRPTNSAVELPVYCQDSRSLYWEKRTIFVKPSDRVLQVKMAIQDQLGILTGTQRPFWHSISGLYAGNLSNSDQVSSLVGKNLCVSGCHSNADPSSPIAHLASSAARYSFPSPQISSPFRDLHDGRVAPTSAELHLVNSIFSIADPQRRGLITGEEGVKIFEGSKLGPATLGDIWAISDPDNNGFLTRRGVEDAIRLIGWAQAGESPTADLLKKPSPAPILDGVFPLDAPPVVNLSSVLPSLLPQDQKKFISLYQKSSPINGLLSGEVAKATFMKSKLPVHRINAIWNLVDTRNMGSLDATQYALAMYFIQGSMTIAIPVLPPFIPTFLWEQAQSASEEVLSRHNSSRSSISSRMDRPYELFPRIWDITPDEKARSDDFFESLDTGRAGYIDGGSAVPFMVASGLSEDILARIWDLADIHSQGRLTKDTFAVAMRLINDCLKGKTLPSTLPPNLRPISPKLQ